MMVDAFLPEGFTELAVDSIFMMPQLGVLSTVHEQAAAEVFEKDCLIRLGTCIAPVGRTREGQPCVRVEVAGDESQDIRVAYGDIVRLPLPADGEARVRVTATPERGFDLGEGRGRAVTREVRGGVVGLLVDGRGRRPFEIPKAAAERIAKLRAWNRNLDIYPREL